LAEGNPGLASKDNRGSWRGAIYVGLVLLAGALFTAYVLLLNGGGR
jgi:hypothetical protein